MKKLNYKTTTYKYNNSIYKDFYIDIVDKNNGLYDVWLYHKDIGIKAYMFGLYKKYFDNYDEFLNCIKCNLENESYIQDYINEYNY